MSTQQSRGEGGVRVLRRKDVLERLGISRTTLNNWVDAGIFPPPINLGPNTRAWLESEVDAMIRERALERDAKTETEAGRSP